MKKYELKSHTHCFNNPDRPCGLQGYHCCLCDIAIGGNHGEDCACPSCYLFYKTWRCGICHLVFENSVETCSNCRPAEEIVICAAVKMDDGYIIRGHRHSDCLLTASKIPKYKDTHAWGENQGFVTSKNRYVDRLEGARIQKAAGIKSKMPEGQEYLRGQLYSEDLY